MEFAYQKHWEDAAETRTVGPLLLKEFRGRWYLLAQMAYGRSRHLACFGLDRMHDLRVTGQPFAPPAGFDATTWYAHAFGITRPTDGQLPQEIRLHFGAVQGRLPAALLATGGKRERRENLPDASPCTTPTSCAWSCSTTARP